MSNIGRREFLARFSSTFAAAAIAPTAALAVHENYYLNRALGIALKKPLQWSFSPPRAFEELAAKQILSDKISLELELEVRNSAEPIVVFGVDVDDDRKFNPSGALYAEHIEIFEHENFDELIFEGEHIYEKILPDFSMIEVIKGMSICGFESVQLVSSFTYETDKISPIPVRNVTAITKRPPFVYTIRFFDAPNRGIDTKSEFENIIRDVYYS